MKPILSVRQLAVLALSVSPLVSALSWPRWLPELDSLVVRADDDSSSSDSASPTATTTTDTKATAAASVTTTTASSTSHKGTTATDSSTGAKGTESGASSTTGKDKSESGSSTTGKDTITESGNSTSATQTSHSSFNATNAVASVVMITPAITDGTELYRIGEFVTFSWNYTNLLGTPTALDVLVSCSVATETWTLTQNMTFETPGSYTWDTGSYQDSAIASPLLTEMYTLIIYDADSSVSGTADPGYLGAYSGLSFGLYTGLPYASKGAWVCVTCSAGVSESERRALGAAVIMSIVTVLSFTWFVTGFGMFA